MTLHLSGFSTPSVVPLSLTAYHLRVWVLLVRSGLPKKRLRRRGVSDLNIRFVGAADLSDQSKSSLAEVIERIQDGVVQVTAGSGSGSGFIIDESGVGSNQRACGTRSAYRRNLAYKRDAAMQARYLRETQQLTLPWFR